MLLELVPQAAVGRAGVVNALVPVTAVGIRPIWRRKATVWDARDCTPGRPDPWSMV